MQQTIQTVTELLQVSPTEPQFTEQLRHLRSQVCALIVTRYLQGVFLFEREKIVIQKRFKAIAYCISWCGSVITTFERKSAASFEIKMINFLFRLYKFLNVRTVIT